MKLLVAKSMAASSIPTGETDTTAMNIVTSLGNQVQIGLQINGDSPLITTVSTQQDQTSRTENLQSPVSTSQVTVWPNRTSQIAVWPNVAATNNEEAHQR